jgi:4-hydroxybenzoate polyprenyltransferase
MIKFPHTVFALPFALMGALLAARGLPDAATLFWILVAMVGARTAAMTFNRLADRRIDADNPRTAGRELPAGIVTHKQAVWLTAAAVLLFEWACFRLNTLCLALSPLALLIILGYSYTKRFTRYSHLVLGLALALAPVGAWVAVKGTVEGPALLLGLAVLCWVAGFDILYALQDMDFDRLTGLHSIPRYWGVRRSLHVARGLHLSTLLLLLLESFLRDLGGIYLAGVGIVGGLLLYEHAIISEHDLSRLDTAFFNMNGYISVTIFAFTLIDLLV